MTAKTRKWCFALSAFIGLASAVWADGTPPLLLPKPGQTVCHAQPLAQANGTATLALCITEGSFSHDQYDLTLSGKTVLHGTDDETTKGIASDDHNQKLGLLCMPQNVMPGMSADQVEKMVPGYAPDKIRALVEKLKDETIGIELGRMCTVSVDGKPAMRVQAVFE